MKIGELAAATHCPVETIRYYEKEGLLPQPGRTAANYRSYDESHVTRLRFIRNCRSLDMTHEEIRALLAFMDKHADDCSGVNQLLDDHIAHVDVRIAELTDLKKELQSIRAQCQEDQSVDDCGIIQGLASLETEPARPRRTHLG